MGEEVGGSRHPLGSCHGGLSTGALSVDYSSRQTQFDGSLWWPQHALHGCSSGAAAAVPLLWPAQKGLLALLVGGRGLWVAVQGHWLCA